jgi:hypothetical protein
MVAPVPAQISTRPRRKLSCPSRRSTPNSCRLILLQTLLHPQSRQPLWNQANPNSFAKTPGVGVPRFPFHPPTAHYPPPTSLRSFPHSFLLFSTACSLFSQNAGGGGAANPRFGHALPTTNYSPPTLLQNPAGWPSARRWPSKERRQAIRASAAVPAFVRDGRFAPTDAGASSLQRRTPSHPQGFWLASR